MNLYNYLGLYRLMLIQTYTYHILISYLLRSYTHGKLILISISRRTHTYSDSLYTVLNLYIYLYLSPVGHILLLVSYVYLFRSPKGHIFRTYTDTCLELIIIQISRRSHRTYSYSELILITDLCVYGSPVGVTDLILIQNLYL